MAKKGVILFVCTLIVIFCTLWTYRNVVKFEFVLLDDELHIIKNPLMSDKASSNRFYNFFLEPYQGLYIPVTYILWASLKKFSHYENKSKVFHTANLIMHSLNAILVMFIIYEITGLSIVSFFGSLFYSLHPLQVEAIAWVSGMKDLLSGMLAFLSLLLWLYYLKSEKNWTKRFFYFFSTFFFILSLLSKPSVVVLPFVAYIISSVKYRLQKLLPIFWWFIPAAIIAIITKILQPNALIENVFPIWSRFFIAADAIVFYLAKLLLPISLCPDYGRTPKVVLSHPVSYIMIIVPVGLLFIFYKKSRWWNVCYGIFIISLLPVLGFIPFFFQAFSTVADRFTYFAMLGPAIGVSLLISKLNLIKKFTISLPLIFILFLISFKQASHWKNSFTLFEHTLKINPKSLLAHNNLATLLEEKKKWVEAIYHYREAIEVREDLAAAHYNLGRVYARLQKYDLSLNHFNKVLSIHPSIPEVQYSVGLIYYLKKNYDKALNHLYHAILINPKMSQANRLIGDIYFDRQNFEKALLRYELLLQISPKDPLLLLKIARCHLEKGSKDSAKNYFTAALKVDPKIDIKKFIPYEKLGVIQ